MNDQMNLPKIYLKQDNYTMLLNAKIIRRPLHNVFPLAMTHWITGDNGKSEPVEVCIIQD